MRVRVKFAKTGAMKFIGHLDVMRYFQKALRRAGMDVAFSEGFSPHMIMSFAAPLGVGITSSGEYFDLDLKSASSSASMVERLNRQMAGGIEVFSVRRIPEDKASKCMTLVAAADYRVTFREGMAKLPENWKEQLGNFLDQETIYILRKTKRSEKDVDIRPWIYSMRTDGEAVAMCLSAGSVSNLKPELVMQAFGSFMGIEFPEFSLLTHREELYANTGEDGLDLVPLEALGEEIE